MIRSFNKYVVFLLLLHLLLCCSTNDNLSEESPVPYAKFSVELQVVSSGYNGEWCWFQPRAAKFGNKEEMVILMQPWVTSHSDFVLFMHEVRTKDGGEDWSAPKSLVDSLGEELSDNVIARICDVTPQFHKKSQKVLATGVTTYYKDSAEFTPSPRETCYFYSVGDKWSSWKRLNMPAEKCFFHASVGGSQWIDLPNGDILLPIYFLRDPNVVNYSVTVLRCHFDGEKLEYLEHGNFMDLDRARGYCEPSLIEFKGKYYLTLRNDINGMVAVSDDGLHYEKPIEWMFNDTTFVWTENTQQHWVKSPKALFLVYTSSHRDESSNVFRGRAPLFMAQFDEKNMVLLKETETILVPNRSAQLGNFGAFEVSENESWVTTSEAMDSNSSLNEANGRVYIAKIKWH